MTCTRGEELALYFYGELPPPAATSLQAHVRTCASCRQELDELRAIRSALADVPAVTTPPDGDWTGFMRRLDHAVASNPAPAPDVTVAPQPPGVRRTLAPYLAMAALLALVTASVALVLSHRTVVRSGEGAVVQGGSEPLPRPDVDPALLSVTGQHFQRSKLVLLGLATMDAEELREGGWRYERELASSLLDDTRLYRRAAETRGMAGLAGVMRDLELVLLQTSMSEEPDRTSIERIQRLIRQRDLMTKIGSYELAAAAGM